MIILLFYHEAFHLPHERETIKVSLYYSNMIDTCLIPTH